MNSFSRGPQRQWMMPSSLRKLTGTTGLANSEDGCRCPKPLAVRLVPTPDRPSTSAANAATHTGRDNTAKAVVLTKKRAEAPLLVPIGAREGRTGHAGC